MTNKTKGKQGEDIAVKYLKDNGYKILERNFHYSKAGEIDIIAKKNFTLCAVEVKTRTTDKFGSPKEAVTKEKLEKIYKTFVCYKKEKRVFHLKERIDVISVLLDGENYKIEHVKNAEL